MPSSPPSCSMPSLFASASSCAQNATSEGSMRNMLESGQSLPPPSHLSLSELSPYTPWGTCRPQEVPAFSSGNYASSVLSPTRFPPPPNSSYQPSCHPNMTFFHSLPSSQYSCELHPPDARGNSYDSREDTLSPSRLDNSSKFLSYWPCPAFSSHNDLIKHSPIGSEAPYPAIPASPQYPLCSSTSFASRFTSSAREFSTPVPPPNAFIQSTSFASGSAPHLSSFPPHCLPFDFSRPTTSRFSLNPHASNFLPGNGSQTSNGSCNGDIPCQNGMNYNSCLASMNILSSPYQGADSFHDASSGLTHSGETAPRPIRSSSPSLFSGSHYVSDSSANAPSSMFAISSSSNPYGRVSFDGTGTRESSCGIPSSSSLSFDTSLSPLSATLFSLYNTMASSLPSCKLASPKMDETDTTERILSESGTILYHQHMSPEEWRWNMCEPLYSQGLVDAAGSISSSSLPPCSYFQTRDQAGPSCVSVSGRKSYLFVANARDKSKIPNLSGSPLKLAASALAEMLALKSTGATNSSGHMLDHVASVSGSALPSDVTPLSEGFRLPRSPERLPDDCCSSTGSVPVSKDANFSFKCDISSAGPVEEGTRGHSDSSDAIMKRQSVAHVENMLEDVTGNFNSVPLTVKATTLNGFGRCQSSTNVQPLATWLPQTAVRQVATSKSVLPRACNSFSGSPVQDATAVSTGCGVRHDLDLESDTFLNLNPLLTQSLDVSRKTESGRLKKMTTQPVGALTSENETSIAGPFKPNPGACDPSTSGTNHEFTSSYIESDPLVGLSYDGYSATESLLNGISPHLSQPRDPSTTMASEVALKGLSRMNVSSCQTLSTLCISGFETLTASISNLTKVLLAFDTSVLAQGDSISLQSSLQSAILRLSECLLLEQDRLNRGLSVSNFAGSCATNESTGPALASKEDQSKVFDIFLGAGASGNKLEPSKHGVMEEEPTVAKTKHGPIFFETIVKTSSDEIEKNSSGVNGSEDIGKLMENIPKGYFPNGSTDVNFDNFTTASEGELSSESKWGTAHDILQFLRDQDMLDLAALKKLIAAEAREEKLKNLVHHLREELELEKEENKGLEEVEARLAVLQGRRGWDTGIGLFTETEPCTPDGFSSPKVWNCGGNDFRGPKPPAIGTMDLGRRSPVTSQICFQIQNLMGSCLAQSNVHCNTDDIWSRYYDVPESQCMGYEAEKEEKRHTHNGIATDVYDNLRSVEARAEMIRSRPSSINIDGVESVAENLNDSPGRKSSCQASLGSRSQTCENDGDDICLVRLRDSDGEDPQSTLKPRMSFRLDPDEEVESTRESLDPLTETVKTILESEDLEEEPGWEHIRLPREN